MEACPLSPKEAQSPLKLLVHHGLLVSRLSGEGMRNDVIWVLAVRSLTTHRSEPAILKICCTFQSPGGLKQSFFNFIFLFIRDREREREAETQAEGEAGSMQGARRGT